MSAGLDGTAPTPAGPARPGGSPARAAGELERKKRFLEFGDEDAARLRDLGPAIESHVDVLVDDFYRHLLRLEELRELLADPERLARARQAQADHLRSLFGGDYREVYAADRTRVGAAHQRVGLTLEWYTGAHAHHLRRLLPLLWDDGGQRREEVLARCDALVKALFLDMSLAIDTYVAAREADLRASEERFRTLVGSMDDFVFTMDPSQRFVAAYGARWRREGISPEALAGKTAADLFDPPAATVHEAACRRALAGEHVVYEWSYLRQEGGERHFQSSLSPLRGPDAAVLGLVGVARDVTEGKRNEARLAAGERLSSLGTLAAGVAHEINNPLTYVVSNLEYLREELLERAPGATHLLPAIEDALTGADRVRGIVRDMKDLSRSQPARPGPADACRALEVAVRMAQHEIRHRGRLVLDKQLVPPVVGDESGLVQVFLNLLVNAAQALPPHGTAPAEIRVSVRPAGSWVVVEVHDTGAGIPADVLPRIFDPFFTTKPVGEGTGLGLSICHAIVAKAGGTITARSAPGQGTTFTVALKASAQPADPPGPAPATPSAHGRRLQVLIVDDDPAVCLSISRLLSKAHGVVAVTSAAEALRLLEGRPRFDVMVCDVMMPEMSGTRLHQEVEKRLPGLATRTLFLTGGVFVKESRDYLEALPNPRLEKPFHGAELAAAVERLGAMADANGNAPARSLAQA